MALLSTTSRPAPSHVVIDVTDELPTQANYAQVLTPLTRTKSVVHLPIEEAHNVRVNRRVYTSSFLALLQVVQFGWGITQVNLGKFNNQADCDARPVVEGTCLIFPGHSKTEWLFVVNSWIIGGMIGGLSSAFFSDRFGRKPTILGNAMVMIVGAVIQAAAPSLPVFAVGRWVAGLASGAAIAMANGYVNEVTPPHLRAMIGSGYGVALATGVFLVSVAFFIADTSTGWRYMGGFPILIASVILLLGPAHMVETPVWLLLHGKMDEGENVLALLYGEENVTRALGWFQRKPVLERSASLGQATEESMQHPTQPRRDSPWKLLFTKEYRRQTLLAINIALKVQLTGIPAVFFYSSTLFRTAGVTDGRIGSLIVGLSYIFPTFFVALLTRRFGNRKMLLGGLTFMLFAAIGLTLALTFHVSTLSIIFVGLFAASFSGSLGALAYPTGVGVFPDELRATGTSLMMFVNWCGTLLGGIGFPYVSSALDDLAFLPFIGTITYFIIFMYHHLPNTTGKTNEEVQDMFRRKVLI